LDSRDEADLDWASLDLFGLQQIVRLGAPGGQARVVSWNGPRGWRVQFLAKLLARKGCERDRALDIADISGLPPSSAAQRPPALAEGRYDACRRHGTIAIMGV
jgi:hypothetical protein